MKLFLRKLGDRNSAPGDVVVQANGVDNPQEPRGHLHPNFQHWTWFRPTDLQN